MDGLPFHYRALTSAINAGFFISSASVAVGGVLFSSDVRAKRTTARAVGETGVKFDIQSYSRYGSGLRNRRSVFEY